ncbi:sigma 54-interacting transcriptional regulator [Escherichia coli]
MAVRSTSTEIGDMPLDVQTRLLRVLADGQFYRVGGYAPVKVDVRLFSYHSPESRTASARKVSSVRDLYHRLNVIRVHLPPLRERGKIFPSGAPFYRLPRANWAFKRSCCIRKPKLL